jgi:capsular polysaccharide biosynthesis protein
MGISRFFRSRRAKPDYRYRELDSYSVDCTRTQASDVFIEKKLLSEPPEGITYSFGPTGYLTRDRNQDYCVIYSPWRNVNNYCHWTFCEVPLIHLALESQAPNIVVADALLTASLPFQARWLKVLNQRFPQKKVSLLSKLSIKQEGMIPLNHDTSSNTTRLIGKCAYRHYHHARATPYCLEVMEQLRDTFARNELPSHPYIYINRRQRVLRNEAQVQEFLKSRGFTVLSLEDYSLDDQVQFFSRARMIIGFHGAGLSNLVFAQQPAAVLEFVDEDCVYPSYRDGLVIPGQKATRNYFHMVAAMKGLRYESIASNNYELDLAALEEKLEPMMA